ncbi:hypothetical protein OPT61_g3102 [Boeremia exigua]|uniref:Uncharacterized protein n=1 Tax=Boeremia exigua TaxID=749465 RepID=A0ACC2IJ52_9PLEO|nr:hypothetical protein OPT61_g3102 [Boeremia exigua]
MSALRMSSSTMYTHRLLDLTKALKDKDGINGSYPCSPREICIGIVQTTTTTTGTRFRPASLLANLKPGLARVNAVILYSCKAGVAAKASNWIGVNLDLAKKRHSSPLKDATLDLHMQEVVVPNTADLGLLGAVVTAALITRHGSLDILQGESEDTVMKLRLSCAQELEQKVVQRPGNSWKAGGLSVRINIMLSRKEQEVGLDDKLLKGAKTRTPQTTAPTPLTNIMRKEGKTWDQAAVALQRNVPTIKKRFYSLPDNGSQGRKRVELLASRDVHKESSLEDIGSYPDEQEGDSAESGGEYGGDEVMQQLVTTPKPLPLLPLEMVEKVPCINADRGCEKLFPCTMLHISMTGAALESRSQAPSSADGQVANDSEGVAGDGPLSNSSPSTRSAAGKTSGRKATSERIESTKKLEDGIPIWAKGHLEDYRRLSGDKRRAKVIVGVRILAAFVPSPPATGFVLDTDSGNVKGEKRRAIKYTKAVEDALEAAPSDPVIVSIGADRFACSSGLIKGFMERNKPYRLTIRHHCIEKKSLTNPLSLTEALLTRDGDVWWRTYESQNILARLQSAPVYGDKTAIDELVAW